MLTMSTTHLRRTWQVDQSQSPDSILFRYKTYFRIDTPLESRGQNTLSSARKKVRQTWRRVWVGPWDRPEKSSMKTSM